MKDILPLITDAVVVACGMALLFCGLAFAHVPDEAAICITLGVTTLILRK